MDLYGESGQLGEGLAFVVKTDSTLSAVEDGINGNNTTGCG
jgi:hypothetical protein